MTHNRFQRSLLANFLVFAGLVLSFICYVLAEKEIDRANDMRIESLQLADELRQSSLDLTLMVRSYVATGEPLYKKHFDDIIDIRDGKKPRPLGYHSIYWDAETLDDPAALAAGQARALMAALKETGVSQAELDLLASSKHESDALTRIEREAMAMVDGTSKDKREQALAMVFGKDYQQARMGIMRPLVEFRRRIDERTLDEVNVRIRRAFQLRMLVIALCCLQMYMLWRMYRSLNETLGCSVDAVHARIQRLASGDFAPEREPTEQRRGSVIGWLSELQSQLHAADTRRRQAEAELSNYAQALEQANLELSKLSRTDALSGLQNRRSAEERLEMEFARFKRSVHAYSVLFIDIDHFKNINDNFGHEVGDKVLQELALVLEGNLRQSDFVARFGGEEFVVLLPETAQEGARVMAEKLRTAVERHGFSVVGHITISIGLSSVQDEDSDEHEVVRRADVALYRAKSAGRNRVIA